MGAPRPPAKADPQRLINPQPLAPPKAVNRGLWPFFGWRQNAFVCFWHILMKGSIISAAEGDKDAAQRAKSMGRLLNDESR